MSRFPGLPSKVPGWPNLQPFLAQHGPRDLVIDIHTTLRSHWPLLTCGSLTAVATIRGDSKITGTVIFEQESESSPTTISWDITGNDPNAERGMHVHQFGDNTNGCTSAGPHCMLPHLQVECKHVFDKADLPALQQSTRTAIPTALLPMRSAMLVILATSRLMPRAMERALSLISSSS